MIGTASRAFVVTMLAAVTLLCGCRGQPVRFVDDLDIEIDFDRHDELHTPYVQGSQVRIDVRGRSDSEYFFESSDPEVLTIREDSATSARVTAAGPGVAELRLMKPGRDEPVHSAEITVQTPTRVELSSRAALLRGDERDDAQVFEPRVVTGGTATFEVRFFSETTRLYGNRVLVPEGNDRIAAERESSELFEDREWLHLTPSTEGTHEVPLSVAGVTFTPVTVHAVAPSAVDRIELTGEQEDDYDQGDAVRVVAQGYDAEDRPLYGLDLQWLLDGTAQEGEGDLFRYTYDPDALADLEARHEDLSATTEVHARGGTVGSSTNVGCMATGAGTGAGAAPTWALVLAAVVVPAVRRRSRRSRR